MTPWASKSTEFIRILNLRGFRRRPQGHIIVVGGGVDAADVAVINWG